MNENITHDWLVALAVKALVSRKCVAYITEPTGWSLDRGERPDAIGWRHDGQCVVVECKTSRTDFLADRAKAHRASLGLGHERFYLSMPGVVRPADVPEGWGLLHVAAKGAVCVVPAPVRDAHDDQRAGLVLLHLVRRACDYKPHRLLAKINDERAKSRAGAKRYREALARQKAEREAWNAYADGSGPRPEGGAW